MKMNKLLLFFAIFASTIQLVGQTFYEVKVDKLNVTNGPDLNADIIGSFKKHDIVVVLGLLNGWAVINYNETQAYVEQNDIVAIDEEAKQIVIHNNSGQNTTIVTQETVIKSGISASNTSSQKNKRVVVFGKTIEPNDEQRELEKQVLKEQRKKEAEERKKQNRIEHNIILFGHKKN